MKDTTGLNKLRITQSKNAMVMTNSKDPQPSIAK